ncbi:MAG: PTPA-CTERM sorting domain-containing protein [Limnothrix sp.]
MRTKKIIGLGLIAAGTVAGSLLADVKPADAFQVHNGWNYSIDAKNDSTTFKRNGSGLFEIYGSAYKIVGEKVVFAINSNVDLENGVEWQKAADKRVDFGDVLINFTGESLDEANGELFGIRFAPNNDSGVSQGVYSNVDAVSVGGSNDGWSSLNKYNNYVRGKNVTPTIGDLAYDDSYFDLTTSPLNSISSGTKVGDIEFLTDLNSIGLDFDFFGNVGSELIAFTFDKGLLPTGKALYHLAIECNNDIVAGHYESSDDTTDVPTPAAILPAILGMFGAASRKKNETEENA